MPRLRHLADGLFRYRWYAGILLFALLVLTGVHGFSIGEWDVIVRKPSAEYSFPSVGEHRRIRSDEWAVSLPFVRAQCLHPDFFPAIRHDLNGGRMDMLLFTPPNPVWDATVPGQAANWGYFLFGFARGLSWSWFLRYLIGFLFAFEFFLIWLRGDRALALVAALSVVLGAPSIWWTTTIPYHQLFFFSTLVFLNRIFAWRNPAAVLGAGAGLFVSLSSFAFSFYPPFQVLYALIALPLAVEMVQLGCRSAAPCGLRTRLPAAGTLVLALAAFLVLGLLFLNRHAESIQTIANSAYPGNRRFSGGNPESLMIYLARPLFSVWNWVVTPSPNECEATAFFAPLIPVFALTLLRARCIFRASLALPWLFALAILMLLWCALPWPAFLVPSFLSQIAPYRMQIGLGFISFLLLLQETRILSAAPGASRLSRPAVCILLLLTLAAGIASLCFSREARPFFAVEGHPGLWLLSVSLLLYATLSAGFLRINRPVVLFTLAVVAVLSGAFVHPLSIGESPIADKQLVERARLAEAEYGPGLWLCNESNYAQFLLANGFTVLPGIQNFANPALWKQIDPEEQFLSKWNCYAHVSYRLTEGPHTAATLRPGEIRWQLTEADVRALGVRYLLVYDNYPKMPWLEKIGRSDWFSILRVLPESEYPSP